MKIIFFSIERSGNLSITAAMSRIYGLGKHVIVNIVNRYGISSYTKLSKIPFRVLNKIENHIEKNFVVNKVLKREYLLKVDVLRKRNLYRGLRHRQFLPVHFQRTHTNAKSARYRYQKRTSAQKNKKKGKKKIKLQKKPKLKLNVMLS
jgi:ribosomal protein S13